MIQKASTPLVKTTVVGALAGALVFFALDAVKAQTALTVSQLHANMRPYVGSTVQVTGLVQSVSADRKVVNGASIPYYKFSLYEQDSKSRRTNYYMYIHMPASSFQSQPLVNQTMTITGPLRWSYMFGAIDP